MTGNFISDPVYIGNRGTDLPFNGNIYGLILRGAATTNADLAIAERFLAKRTGVTL